MTYLKLFGFGVGLAVVLVVTKILFYGWFAWADNVTLHFVYWLLVVVLTAALVRRLGLITVLEAVVVFVLWLLLELIGDIAVAGPVVGFRVLVDSNFAVGYLLLVGSVLLFHKKRHVHRRRELLAKA
jgi:hypothetical protein